MTRKIEIDESALSLQIEKVADDVIDTLLRRAQEYEASNRAQRTVNGNAIRATSPISSMVSLMGLEPLSKNELMSISALLAWSADNQNIAQETVQAIVEAEFAVTNVADIQRMHYERAVQFLVDLQINELN
jgi:L-fucose mutarotase/ribose pyranase (RbsD/FucU family)